MYFGCPLLRALNKTGELSFYQGRKKWEKFSVHALSRITAAGGHLWFGVCHCCLAEGKVFQATVLYGF